MSREIEVTVTPEEALPKPHFSLADIFRWLTLIEEVIAIWNGVHALQVGGDQPVPDIKVSKGSARYTWHAGTIHRDA